jgi:hypothetical protein
MFIALFCEFRHRTGRMPQSTHEAFEGFVTGRLARDRQRLETLGIALDDLREGAEQIAFSMSAATDLGLAPSRADIAAAAAAAPAGATPTLGLDALLDALETVQLGGAPVDGAGTAGFEFRRRRIQEYFATRHVLKHPSKVAPQRLLTDERGRETAVTLLQTGAPGCCRSL